VSYDYPAPSPVPQTEQKAVWALVCAIAGFVLCPIVLHVAGWVLANQALESIRASNGWLLGDGLAKAARILSIIGLALFAVGLLFVLFIAFVPLSAS